MRIAMEADGQWAENGAIANTHLHVQPRAILHCTDAREIWRWIGAHGIAKSYVEGRHFCSHRFGEKV